MKKVLHLKETLKNNLDTCTGIPGQRLGKNGAGRGNGQGTGHMSGGGMLEVLVIVI